MTILVTGGAGYIGTHTVLRLLAEGFEVLAFDSLSTGRREGLERVQQLAGKQCGVVEGDVRDRKALRRLFGDHRVEAVIHLAASKFPEESMRLPLAYYDNNVGGLLALLELMDEVGVRALVFSSSAAIYDHATTPPFREESPLGPVTPYGRTKLCCEQLLGDLARADPRWAIVILRYFNPVGAHPSGLIGEDPVGVPGNLFPILGRVAAGVLPELKIHGDDYPTCDGSPVRDFLHVCDLAEGHVAAVRHLRKRAGVEVFNLGTGTPHSVLAVAREYETAAGRPIPRRVGPRRAGDVAASWADASKANRVLGWRPRAGLEQMCRDVWNWQCRNPKGYART